MILHFEDCSDYVDELLKCDGCDCYYYKADIWKIKAYIIADRRGKHKFIDYEYYCDDCKNSVIT